MTPKERKAVEKIERVRNRALAAAARLLDARPPGSPTPTNAEDFMDMIDGMAKASRKIGVLLTEPDKRAIALYHKLICAVILGERAREKARAESERNMRLGITPTEPESA